MRLAIVTAYPPSLVTLQEYGYHLVKNFAQNPTITRLYVLCDNTDGKKLIDFPNAEKVEFIDCWRFNSYTNLPKIVRTLWRLKPDGALFNLQFMKFGDKKIPATLGLMSPFLSKFSGTRSVVLLHNIMEQVDLEKAGFTQNKILNKVYSLIGTGITKALLQANLVSFTIRKYVDIVKNKYHTSNLICIPHGTFEVLSAPDFDLPNGTKKIMAFGKFGTYKKIEPVVQAVELLRKKHPDWDLTIVIAGTDSPNTLGYLENMKLKYKNVPQLEFTGYVPESEVQKIFTESAIVAFPYTSTTGSSGVLHQAGSYGKAVVLPNLGDLANLIEEEGYAGAFFEADNATSLADAIEILLTDDGYRRKIAIQNFQAASALSMDKIVQQYIDAFQSIPTSAAKKAGMTLS